MIIPLSGLKEGMRGKIVDLEFEEQMKNRFMAMGIVPGKEIEIDKISPFGDPIVYRIGENKVTLRRSEAERIKISVDNRILTLSECSPGLYVVVEVFRGPIFWGKMQAWGLYPGTVIEVLDNSMGKVLIRVGNREIMLGRGQSRKIFCIPFEE